MTTRENRKHDTGEPMTSLLRDTSVLLTRRGQLAGALTLLVCTAVIVLDVLGNLSSSITLALVIFTLSALLLAWLPPTVAATLFLLGAVTAELAPARVVFSGFHSAALWLVMGSMLISTALVRSGIDNRIAALFDALPSNNYAQTLITTMLIGLALLMIVPSAFSRVVLIIPIAAAFAERQGFSQGSRGFNGIVIIAVCSTYLTSFSVLTTSYPNLVIAGIVESLFAIHLSYVNWIAMNFPVFGLLRLALIFCVIYLLFPAILPEQRGSPDAHRVTKLPWTAEQKMVVLITALAIVLWATDFWHGISAGWVGMAAGLGCFARPVTGESSGKFVEAIDVGPILLIAGLMGIGAVIAHTGTAELLSPTLTASIPFSSEFGSFYALALINFLAQFVTTNAALPPVMLPASEAIAGTTGHSLNTVLAAHIAGYSNLPMPHLAGPTIYAMYSPGIMKVRFIAVIVLVALGVVLLLWPTYFGWLKLIGFL